MAENEIPQDSQPEEQNKKTKKKKTNKPKKSRLEKEAEAFKQKMIAPLLLFLTLGISLFLWMLG